MHMQTTQASPHTEVHEAHHEDLGFWRSYVFSTDHKIIGIQYGVTALSFLMFGFLLMLMMRWSMAEGTHAAFSPDYHARAIPLIGPLLEKLLGASKGIINGDLYNSFGAMHGTIMVFMAIVPLAFAAFGNYVVPLMIGAPDMA